MAVPVDVLRACPGFRSLSGRLLDRIAELGEEIPVPAAYDLTRTGERPRIVHIIKTGMVAIYVHAGPGEWVPFEILGPGRIVELTILHDRAGESEASATTLMPTILIAFNALQLQALLFSEPQVALPILEEVLDLLLRRVKALLRALVAQEVSFPTEEACPIGRPTRFLSAVNTTKGEVHLMCQRNFTCDIQAGMGCPLAEKPPQSFHRLGPWRAPLALPDRPSLGAPGSRGTGSTKGWAPPDILKVKPLSGLDSRKLEMYNSYTATKGSSSDSLAPREPGGESGAARGTVREDSEVEARW